MRPFGEVGDGHVAEPGGGGGQIAVLTADQAQGPYAVGAVDVQPGERDVREFGAGERGDQADAEPGRDEEVGGARFIALAGDDRPAARSR